MCHYFVNREPIRHCECKASKCANVEAYTATNLGSFSWKKMQTKLLSPLCCLAWSCTLGSKLIPNNHEGECRFVRSCVRYIFQRILKVMVWVTTVMDVEWGKKQGNQSGQWQLPDSYQSKTLNARYVQTFPCHRSNLICCWSSIKAQMCLAAILIGQTTNMCQQSRTSVAWAPPQLTVKYRSMCVM